MKKIALSTILLIGFAGTAFADDYMPDSAKVNRVYQGAGQTSTESQGFAAVRPGGCDEAAGSETKQAACEPDRITTPGGTNSGGSGSRAN
jgi:hypothetical protein